MPLAVVSSRCNVATFANISTGFHISTGYVAGESQAIRSVNAIAKDIAGTNISVLLVGESGTGKEIYARLIHSLSKRSGVPITKVSCRAREPEELLAELKPLLKDSPKSPGNVPGTLFLDGIDELELGSQKVLLSQLPEAEPDEIDGLRRIATAIRDLNSDIETCHFRRDLYYRINGACIRLPALRERRQDIPVMMEHFLAKHSAELLRTAPVLTEEDLQFFGSYEWPGNVRELANVAKKVVLFGEARKVISDLEATPRSGAYPPKDPGGLSLKAVARAASRQAERGLIVKALERTRWNRKQAAHDLGVSYKSLLYKIKETGLDGKNPGGGKE